MFLRSILRRGGKRPSAIEIAFKRMAGNPSNLADRPWRIVCVESVATRRQDRRESSGLRSFSTTIARSSRPAIFCVDSKPV